MPCSLHDKEPELIYGVLWLVWPPKGSYQWVRDTLCVILFKSSVGKQQVYFKGDRKLIRSSHGNRSSGVGEKQSWINCCLEAT